MFTGYKLVFHFRFSIIFLVLNMTLICKIKTNTLLGVRILSFKPTNQNARDALKEMKMEIANEFDANLTNGEKYDGSVTRDLISRAERKIKDLDTFNPS